MNRMAAHNPIATAAASPRGRRALPRRFGKLTRLAGLVFIATLAVVPAKADRITLRDGVAVSAVAGITLADVAHLDGDAAEALGDVHLGRFAEGADERTITRRQVSDALTEAGVHWGRVSLRGRRQITVRRLAVRPAQGAAPADRPLDDDVATGTDEAAGRPVRAAANPVEALRVAAAGTGGRSLEQVLDAWLADRLGVARDDLRIDYERGDEALQLNEGNGPFEIRSASSDLAGRTILRVRQIAGDRIVADCRLTADVRVRRPVVVARRSIQRGQTLTGDDLEQAVRWVDSLHPAPLDDAGVLVGQTASRTVRRGSMLVEGDAEPAVLVERGQRVDLYTISGALVIKTIGRAAEDGHLDQVIAVRHPRTREMYHARVTGPRQVTMRIDAAAPAPAAADDARSSSNPGDDA